ncbi:MAG: pentapeptide repeat-containing protein [Clostridiales bacterium]|nr:pentapeptide repeat-containing protein [Clostridiales bacterium]
MHKQSWFTEFEKHFLAVCANIVKIQDESIIPAISHLEYTMKYTNFLNRRYIAEVWVYGDDWYLDKDQRMVWEYDISFLFVHFDELWDKLLTQRKRYVGKVSAQEVTSFMIEALPKFYSYLINIARFAITDCIDEKPFTDIVKNDIFKVRIGDYMAQTEPVFTQKKNKNADKLANWFSEKLKYDYVFEDCAGLDFSARDFFNTAFRYVQFRRTILNDAILQSCSLIGASFYKAQMENCLLDNSTIYEADFSYANMKNASLIYVRGRAGLPNENEWKHVGFLPVSFKGADLSGADFKWANLTGADFSGANLTGTKFTCAILDDAVFTGALLDGTDFTGTVFEGADPAVITKKGAAFAGPHLGNAAVSIGIIGSRAEYMHYYTMEPAGALLLPAAAGGENTELVLVSDFKHFNDIDYDARSELISERLKLLMEQYLPEYDFEPVVFYDKEKDKQTIYWRFQPPLYEDFHTTYRSDGIVKSISFPINDAPIVFTVRSPKAVRSIVVRMAVAESILRRSILGVKFTKVLDSSSI